MSQKKPPKPKPAKKPVKPPIFVFQVESGRGCHQFIQARSWQEAVDKWQQWMLKNEWDSDEFDDEENLIPTDLTSKFHQPESVKLLGSVIS